MSNHTLERQPERRLGAEIVAIPDAPVATSADRCREIRRSQEAFRESLAQFLNQPSMDTYERLRAAGGTYLGFERRIILPFADSNAATDFQADELRMNHDLLVRGFNLVLWDTLGTARLVEDVAALRHTFLQQVELCERAVCPVIDLR